MARSVFCATPPGQTQDSVRVFRAIIKGCIPVTFYRGNDRPFERHLHVRPSAALPLPLSPLHALSGASRAWPVLCHSASWRPAPRSCYALQPLLQGWAPDSNDCCSEWHTACGLSISCALSLSVRSAGALLSCRAALKARSVLRPAQKHDVMNRFSPMTRCRAHLRCTADAMGCLQRQPAAGRLQADKQGPAEHPGGRRKAAGAAARAGSSAGALCVGCEGCWGRA